MRLRLLASVGLVLVAVAIALVSLGARGKLDGVVRRPGLRAPHPHASSAPRTRRGGMELTFLVTADTHLGFLGTEERNRRAIAAMNAIAGKPLPSALGGVVGSPAGVLVAGDLTEHGRPEQWERFLELYGTDGSDGELRFPLYETIGNHDKHHGWHVKQEVEKRHGGVRYAWDWQDVHLVCLGEAPDDDDLAWLTKDLDALGPDVGVILYFHFALEGPFSRRHWFGDGRYRDHLAAAIEGRRILGIFHGHFHATGHYRWRGHDVFNVGSVKHDWQTFAVVRLSDERMSVASYDPRKQSWAWWYDKPIFDAQGESVRSPTPMDRYVPIR